MATYSSSQAYISTTRYFRTSVAVANYGDVGLYTCPALVEAHLYIQYLRFVVTSTSADVGFAWLNTSGTQHYTLGNAATPGTGNQFGFSDVGLSDPGDTGNVSSTALRQENYKLILLPGEALTFRTSTYGGTSQYQYDFIVKEYVKA